MAIDYLNTRGLQDFWQAVREYYSEAATKKVDEATQADHFARVMNLALAEKDNAISGNVYFDGSQDVILVATVKDVTDALHGFMTPAQKIKLDNIEEGGQVNILEGIKVIFSRESEPVLLPIDANKDVTLDLSTYALIQDVTDERDRASTKETELATAIDTEKRTREADSVRLQAQITAEELRAKDAEETISGNLSTETTNRENADTSLSNRIDSLNFTEIGEEGKFVSSISQTSGEISSTLTAFISDISTTDGGASTIAPQSVAVRSYIDSEILAEATARFNTDTSISQDLATEAQTRANADTSLSTALGNEITAREAADTSLTSRIADEETNRANAIQGLQNTIDAMDYSDVGSADSFLYSIAQENGVVSVSKSTFISDIENNAASTTAPQTAAIKTYVDESVAEVSGDLERRLENEILRAETAEGNITSRIEGLNVDPAVGSTGSFISLISQSQGQLSAESTSFISNIANSTTSTIAPQTAAVATYVNAETSRATSEEQRIEGRINDLNVNPAIGSTGSFISLVSQSQGQLSAESTSFISDITDSTTSTIAPQTAAVVSYVGAEATARETADTSLSGRIDDIIASTTGTIDSRIAAEATLREEADTSLSTRITNLSTTEAGAAGKFIYKIRQDSGLIYTTVADFISDISTTPGSESTTAPQSIAVKSYVDNRLSTEITARENADTSLSTSLTNEISARSDADTALSTSINNITASTTGIIDTRIAAETSRAETAEASKINGLSEGTTENNILTWGSDGYHVKDSGYTIQTSVPSGAVFTDTTYSASNGITLTGTNFTNSGVRAVTASTSAGYINVDTNGSTTAIQVMADLVAGHGIEVGSGTSAGTIINTGVLSVVGSSTSPGHIVVNTNGTTADINIAPPLTAGTGIDTSNNIITNTGVLEVEDGTTNGTILVTDKDTTTTITVYEHYSSSASGSYGSSTAQTPAYGSTFSIPYITVNSEGHISAAENISVKIPDALTSLPSEYGLTIQTNGTTQVDNWTGSTSASVNITYTNVGAAAAEHTHNNYSSTVSTTGGGDLITAASITGNTLTVTKGQSTTNTISDTTALPTAAAVRGFVNSSINNMAAFYITKDVQGDAFATKAELDTAVQSGIYYSGGHLRTPTNNDYCMILEDETHDDATCRYMYVVPEGQSVGSWSFQYKVNTSFTQAQSDAINSGITAADVTKLAGIEDNANNYIHPSITATGTTSTTSATFGGTFTAIDSVTVNSEGHVEGYNTKTVTLPSNPNTDTYPSAVSISSVSGANNPVITIERAGSTTSSITGNIPLASSTVNGVVSTTTQTFAGVKTFRDDLILGENVRLAYAEAGNDRILTFSFISTTPTCIANDSANYDGY